MFSEHAVKLATKYLDECFEKNEQATMVRMLFYVDFFERLVMTLDEMNAALSQRPSVFVHRTEGQIEFRPNGVERTITENDLQRGIEQYHEYFRAQFEKLNAQKSMGNR